MTANRTASFIRHSVRGGPIRWLIFSGAFLIAAVTIGATIMADNFRERALNSSERELENTVLLLARHFDQQLEDFEVVQKDLIAYMRSSGIASSEAYRRRMSGQDIHLMLKAKLSALSYVGGINIFDADGMLINASSIWPVPTVRVGDRSYFKAFKSDPQSPDMLIEPVYSRVTGVWTTVIAHKMTGPDGEFLGAIGRGIEPANFEKFFASLALGDDAAISMYHRDGTLLARYPHVEAMIGQNFMAGPVHQQVLSKSDQGTIRLTSPIDGKERLASARTLSHFPISVIATTTVAAALADWREQTRFLIAVAGLSVLVIAVMLFLVVRRLSQQHQLEKQRLDTAINNMTQGLLMFDSSHRLVVANQRYIEMFGVSTEVVKPGCTMHDLLNHRKEIGSFTGDADEYCSTMFRKLRLGKIFQTILDASDGRSIQVSYRPLPHGGWVTTLEDITERRRAEERITHLAHYDALTDLPNRALFHDQLKRELARMAPGEQLAVLYIDIDEFKTVNDTLGHLIGDELLKSVAVSLGRCVSATDFVARLGGDEFAIVQTAVKTPDEVSDLVTRVLDAIREPYECLGHQVTTDASIGIALAPQHGADLDQILKNADMAMYAAKSAGRRTYRFFEPEMDTQVKAAYWKWICARRYQTARWRFTTSPASVFGIAKSPAAKLCCAGDMLNAA
jgi:diguanylate cyclase (GGDEF)-like protein